MANRPPCERRNGNVTEVANTDDAALDLALMLIYLTSWTEDASSWLNEPPLRRCWKGFRFEILDGLENQEMVEQSRRATSLYLSRAGEQESRKLLAQHGFAPDAAKSSRGDHRT